VIANRNCQAYPSPDCDYLGLTCRQVTAIEVLAGLAATSAPMTAEYAAQVAVAWADALWDALEEPETKVEGPE
jgi:hypothetical protein